MRAKIDIIGFAMKCSLFLRSLAISLVFLLAGAIFIAPAPTQAATASDSATIEDPHGYSITTDEMQSYYNAISDCSTPSLECLVRNVSRFTAIEWIQDINGPKADCISNPEGCNESSSTGGKSVASGALGGLGNLIGSMYNYQPASAGTYVADVLNSAHIVTPAYAQGLGFASLDPILSLWKTFRNIAYMFFVIIFVITGFLIMFRQKVGQTAITAQQAIPKIIVSLLMVTFSYAIGGFLIDLMYLSMVLIMGIFNDVLGDANYLGMNIINLGGNLWGRLETIDFKDVISTFIDSLTGENTPSGIASVLGGLTLSIILTIAMLIGLVKLFFELLRDYATIVISVATSPLTLMLNAIPGNNAFSTWIKTLIGNLLPFPVVLVVVAMFNVFVHESWGSGGFMPPFLLGGGQLNVIPSVLGLAILLALPEIVKHVRESIAPKNAFSELIMKSATEGVKAGWSGKTPYGQVPLGISGRNFLNRGLGAGMMTATATGKELWNTRGMPIGRRANIQAAALGGIRNYSNLSGDEQLQKIFKDNSHIVDPERVEEAKRTRRSAIIDSILRGK